MKTTSLKRFINKIRVLVLTVVFITPLLSACSKPSEDSVQTGSITAQLVWPSTNTTLQRSTYATIPSEVTLIRAKISASDMTDVSQEFNVALHKGVVTGVPVGSNRSLVLSGLDASKTEIYKSEAKIINVVAGITNNAGTIEMLPVDNSSSSSSVTTNGLVAYYPFNGNANGESGNGNNGTVNGATLTTDRKGNVNSAYSFDGVNDLIEIPDSSTLDVKKLTMSTWIYRVGDCPSVHDTCMIFNKDYEYGIQSGNELKWAVNLLENGATKGSNWRSTGIIIPAQVWVNVVLTFDGSKVKVYSNGVLQSQVSWTGDIQQNAYVARIGNRGDLNGYTNHSSFYGFIDDIRIYNRALSASEIQVLYNE